MTNDRALRPRASTKPAPEPEAAAPAWTFEWTYFTLLVVSWCVTPLLRRLIDYRAGAFNPVTVTSLLPFVMLLPLALICFRPERLARLTPLLRLFSYVWAATFVYGFLIAFANGSFSAGAFELVEYMLPMLAGIWLAGQELPADRVLTRLARIILPCAGIVGIYGLLQWVSPPPWDVMWVKGADFISIGDPSPFVMRLFATLNAPGPAADFFALTIVLSLPLLRLRRLWAWPLVGILGAALLLTMIREAWVGLIVGTIVYLVLSPKRLSALPSLAMYVALLVFLVSSLPVLMGSTGGNADTITDRISTFGDVDHDDSALERTQEIDDALAQGLSNPLGEGLGAIGAAAKLGSNPTLAGLGNVLDSGYLARLLELGWLGTAGYLFVVLGAPIALGMKILGPGSSAGVDVRVAGATAIALCMLLAWGDAANDAHLGLDGFLFWLAMGLGSLAVRSSAAPAAAARVPRWQRART